MTVGQQIQQSLSRSAIFFGYLGILASLMGFLSQLHWFLALASHFRIQYALGLAILGLLLLIFRRWVNAAIILVFAVINGFLLVPLFVGGSFESTHDGPILRVMAYNVNTSQGKPQEAKQVIESFDPDVLVLAEVSARWLGELKPLLEKYPYSRAVPRDDNFGIGLYSKFPLEEIAVEYLAAASVPTIMADVEWAGDKVRVIATHPLPPIGGQYSWNRNQQILELSSMVPQSGPTLVVGDLNITRWDANFAPLLKHPRLNDSSVGQGWQPTWPAGVWPLMIPIDHAFYSDELVLVNREVGPAGGSDHLPVIIDVGLKAPTVD
ncbi:MAG: endonuclease/exonuclease/phosphatase family protein [Verrucomicrobiota bacterium]